MRDVRMVTLYKQHYLDDYKYQLKSQYSCWGYYDGIDITEVKEAKSRIVTKLSKAPVSELWYCSVDMAKKLEGLHSRQNIGIFRCVEGEKRDKAGIQFWEEHKRMPFFSVGFVQLKDRLKYDEVCEVIEETWQSSSEDLPDEYKTVAYGTFDNADMVILIHGNRIGKLEYIIRKIEELAEVSYVHSIMGVSEEYLKEFYENPQKINLWNGTRCNLTEKVSNVIMKLATSGEKDILERIKYELMKSYSAWNGEDDKVTYSFVTGHENIVISIKGVEVKNLLELLKPGAFATHQNALYGSGIYNIETSIQINEKSWKDIVSKECNRPEDNSISWCGEIIKKYKVKLSKAFSDGDESLYSYYQALIQTLNTLAQYERFGLSKDIFYLLFPTFKMFDSQLEKALTESNDKPAVSDIIKESVCKYLDSVNSVIYHTIHTDQVFLMIPGYSGTTFSIPIKLCLFYLWFINKSIFILNDSECPTFEYQCVLTPGMESKPITSLISMGLPHGNRLINVELSQRSLYMPRDLMIILSHEIAHYVGEGIRNRKLRLEYIIKTLSFILTEGIIPDKLAGVRIKKTEIERNLEIKSRQVMQNYIMDRLSERLARKCTDGKYYASEIGEELQIACEELLTDEEHGVYKVIYDIPTDIISSAQNNNKEFLKISQILCEAQNQFDFNRKELIASGIMRTIVSELINIYKEVLSDVAAFAILEFEPNYFEEAFSVSEGTVTADESADVYRRIRQEIIEGLRDEPYESTDFVWNGSVDVNQEREPLYRRLLGRLYMFNCTKDLLKKYSAICYHDLKERTESDKYNAEVNKLRESFRIFTGANNYSCKEIYCIINEKIHDYIVEVNEIYNDRNVKEK